MYTTTQPGNINGTGIVDAGPGTIDPAALNAPGPVLPNPTDDSPRGTKRSRSPETSAYPDDDAPWLTELPTLGASADSARARKRGRPPKVGKHSLSASIGSGGESSAAGTPTQARAPPGPAPVGTPGIAPHAQPLISIPNQPHPLPPQASPPRAAPAKNPTIKALPTVRDHTTDQLTPAKDEYEARERDDAGERKVAANGELLGGRNYQIRTFILPGRGDRRFMLATECARVLHYRDSYLLFNKNRSLYKIIASQAEKDHLIAQDLLPYSYRSRQIAIVTARSMFRQFGSRVVEGGRRVRDDYWEAKARKQGFTEDDLAGDKRPGGQKAARDAQAAADAAMGYAHGPHDISYSNGPAGLPVDAHGHPIMPHLGGAGGPPGAPGLPGAPSLAPLPMIHPLEPRDFAGIARPRQDLASAPTPPYADQTRAAPGHDMLAQSQHAAAFSAVVNEQARARARGYDDFYAKPRDVAPAADTTPAQHQQAQHEQAQAAAGHAPPGASQGPHLQLPAAYSTSAQVAAGLLAPAPHPSQQQQHQQHQQHQQQMSFAAAGGPYAQPQPHHPGAAPARGMPPQQPHPPQMHAPSPHHAQHPQQQSHPQQHRPPVPGYPPPPPHGYGYPPQQMPAWAAAPPQPSPLQQAHLPPQYGGGGGPPPQQQHPPPSAGGARQSPHPNPSPSPRQPHPPHPPPPPQQAQHPGPSSQPGTPVQGAPPPGPQGTGSPAMHPGMYAGLPQAYGQQAPSPQQQHAQQQQQRALYQQQQQQQHAGQPPGSGSPYVGQTSGPGASGGWPAGQGAGGWQGY